jgi:hypothetical protein
MSVHLAPVVAKKLEQFRRRRFMLILARGLCSGVITFLICFAIVSAIDWYWLLDDQVRWYLSGAAYICVAIAVWVTCLRRMIHLPAMEEIATQMEMTEPELRENLLSAVELATDDEAALNDSPVFRSLLQGKVAEQMTQVRVRKLLPMKLVAKWMLAAVALFAVAAFLLTAKDPRFRQLATRAILPGANLARVSRIHVEVLAPSPQSQMIAEDETVAVSVAVSGGNVNEVILESFTEKDGTVQRTMLGQTDSEYIANLHVGNESVEYRILAGDAVTERFRLEAKPRPHVVAFQKTFAFPEYAQLSDKKVTENHGDLLALIGTEVELVMELDQDVSEAELQIDLDDSEELQRIPLTQLETKEHQGKAPLWSATVPVEKSAIYKVHLVSKETGFQNVFTPRYEIRPEADLIPKAGFVDQQESTLLLPPSDILSLKGIAEDDLPLVELEQQFSINGQDWESLSLKTEAGEETEGRQLTAAWQWDLLNLKLKAGDQVLTKLVATDRKGNLGESVPLRIIVAAQDFDPDRHQLMEKKVALYDELKEYQDLLSEQKTTALEVIERLRTTQPKVETGSVDQGILIDLAKKQQEQAAYLLAKIKDVGQQMPAGADAYDLDLVGKVMSRLQREHTSLPAYLMQTIQIEDNENETKKRFAELKRAFEKTADDAKHIADHYQQLIAHNFMMAVAFDLNAIKAQQQLIVDSPTQSWDRLLRQETIILNQLDVLEQLVRNQRRRMPTSFENHLKDLLKWSEKYRQQFQDNMESDDQLAKLQQTSKSFHQELQNRQHYANIDGGLAGRIMNARRDLDNRAGNLYVSLEQLSRAVQQENQLMAKATESSDSEESKKLSNDAEAYVAEIDLKLMPSTEQLRDRRAITQVRADSDAQYAADTGLTSRAIQFLMSQHREIAPHESTLHDALREITFAFRTLEAGHEFAATKIALEVFANQEQWDSQKIEGRLEHPRQWEFIGKAFELASQRLREAGVQREIVDKFDKIRWSPEMRDASRKITERRWKRGKVTGAGHEIVGLREKLEDLDSEIQPVMAEARKIIAKYAPTIPQMAKQAADDLRELEKETTESADNLEQPESTPETQEAELAAIEEQQDQINQQLDDLMEALVEDANSQDLLQEEERERARDADDSIAMIQEPAKEMNRELQAALESDSNEQKAQDLSEAAKEQEKTAQALDLIAEHFDRLEQNVDVAESREELRQTERELGIARQMDQRFEESQQLEQMVQQNADDLLAELTEELKNNPAMQKALSEISKNSLQDAQSTLELAAQDDQNIQRANEQSDADFQAKKKELSEDLRTVAADASRLSRDLLNQAKSAAQSGKSPEAQEKLNSAQQKLNEVAAKANNAREDQLLADLAEAAQAAQKGLEEVTEDLKAAEKLTEASKNEKIHNDDNARNAQKNEFEKRQQQFQEQQKRVARDQSRNADNAKKREDQNVRNAENQVRNQERQEQQAQNNLNRKPDDQGLKRNLEQAKARVENEKQKLTDAKEKQKEAEADAKQAKQKSDEENRKKLPSLDAQNPASQLADRYTEEGIQVAEELKQMAKQLADSSNFGEELTPSQNQLAASEQRQAEITEDVQQAADDVARASRHEERLQNTPAAEALDAAAKSIEQVAQGESTTAEQQIAEAVGEAEQAAAQPNQPPQRSPEGLQAQAAIAQAEAALSQQAEQLEAAMQPLLAENQNAENQGSAQQPTPPNGDATAQNQPPPQGNAEGSPQQSPQGDPGTPAASPGQEASQPSFSAEEMALGEQLAQTLDELDRQMANAEAATPGEAPNTPTQSPPLATLAQAAKAQQASIATTRAQQQQAADIAMNEGDAESDAPPSATGPMTDFNVALVNRTEKADWGKLRNKSAEDLSKGQTQGVSEEYRKSVETYFRVLAERARKK